MELSLGLVQQEYLTFHLFTHHSFSDCFEKGFTVLGQENDIIMKYSSFANILKKKDLTRQEFNVRYPPGMRDSSLSIERSRALEKGLSQLVLTYSEVF